MASRKLKDKFNKRDITFNNATSDILMAIPHVLEGIVQFLELDKEAEEGNLVWEDINRFIESEDDEGFIIVTGIVIYNPGETFELTNGEIVEITEDNADYFRRVVRTGIPFDVADRGTQEDVVAFLEKAEVEIEIESNEGLEQIVDDQDFDLESLTPEQRQAYEMFNK